MKKSRTNHKKSASVATSTITKSSEITNSIMLPPVIENSRANISQLKPTQLSALINSPKTITANSNKFVGPPQQHSVNNFLAPRPVLASRGLSASTPRKKSKINSAGSSRNAKQQEARLRNQTVGQKKAIAVLNNNRKKLSDMLPGNSFVLASSVQQASYSNSSKQVHLNLVRVDSGIQRKTSKDKLLLSTSPKKRAAKRNKFVSQGNSGANFLNLSKLTDHERCSRNNTSSASTCLSAASQGQPMKTESDADKDFYNLIKLKPMSMQSRSHRGQTNESLLEARVRLRTSEPGKRLKQMFLEKHKHQNRHIEEVLDKSEIIQRKSLATINRADLINQRATGLIGATLQIEQQMDYLRNCLVTQCDSEPSQE